MSTSEMFSVTEKTDFPNDRYDLRPNKYEDMVLGAFSGVFARNAKDIFFKIPKLQSRRN